MYRGFVFLDWDDTVAENITHFVQAEQAMSRLMAGALGLDAAAVYARGRSFDVETARRMGLVRLSFPTAWTACYDALCHEAGEAPDKELRRQLWAMADSVYEAEQALLPGAADVVNWLFAQGFEITVWTAGDPRAQNRKIDRSGLGDRVHRRCVVPHKTPGALRTALAGRALPQVAVIGNSAASDVLPALAVGVLAVHVPTDTWEYDHGEVDPDHPLYVQVDQIESVPGVLAPRFGIKV